jgi:hypothetical protein
MTNMWRSITPNDCKKIRREVGIEIMVRGGVMHRMGYKEGAEIIGGVEIGIWRSTIMWTEELLTGDADDLDGADSKWRDPDERKHKAPTIQGYGSVCD